MSDLFILVADLDIENVIKTLIDRLAKRNSISLPNYWIDKHPNSDPGCFSEGVDFLRETNIRARFKHLLIVFDKEGSGRETWSAERISEDLVKRLVQSGWEENLVSCIVLEPEIENWIWTDSSHTPEAMGWGKNLDELKTWLKEKKNFRFLSNGKPERPKEAALAATKEKRIRFNQIHQQIAEKVSLELCSSPSFLRTKECLETWFPPTS